MCVLSLYRMPHQPGAPAEHQPKVPALGVLRMARRGAERKPGLSGSQWLLCSIDQSRLTAFG